MLLRHTARPTLIALATLIAWAGAAAFPAVSGASGPRVSPLPPANPQRSLGVLEYIWPVCTGALDQSSDCMKSSLAMLNAGRLSEQLGPVVLPSNWASLTVAEQLFVLTELERTARGLPPDTGLAADWNAAAQTGANAGQDPTTGGSGASGFQAVWAGGEPNPMLVVADWVYADGVFPDGTYENLGCRPGSAGGCWSHRDIILHDTSAAACLSRCAVGAAFSPEGYSGGAPGHRESYAEIFGIGGAGNPDPLEFTWASELPQLPACERAQDTCSWNGVLVATAGGLRDAPATAPTAPPRASAPRHPRPASPVALTVSLGRRGQLILRLHTRRRVLGVRVLARDGRRHLRLRVWRRSTHLFGAAGRLSPGRWLLTILYRRPRHLRLPRTTRLHVIVA